MKLAAPKRKLVKIHNFPQIVAAAPKRNSGGDLTVPCGAIITADEVIQYDPTQGKEVQKVANTVPKVNEEIPSAYDENIDESQIRELTLLSLGKKLLDCCKVGNASEVRRLMREGAPFIADWVGTSPLHYSVMNKHVEITEMLLRHGISKNTKNKVSRTPLHVAAHMGLAYMVKLLLTFGADVNCKDMLQMTPLHWAAESGDLLTAKILIDYGADVTVVNKFGKTACAIAHSNKNMEIVRTIQDTELLPFSVRALKVSDMRSKVVSSARDMKPVAEILEPSPAEMKTRTSQEIDEMKKIVVIATDPDLEGTVRYGNIMPPPLQRSESPERMSADSAIKLLQSHGVTFMEPDRDTVVSSAVLNGHMIRLTEAGKLAFKSLENVRLDKLPSPIELELDDEVEATPAKRRKSSSSSPKRESSVDEPTKTSDVIIGSSLAECTIDVSSPVPTPMEDNLQASPIMPMNRNIKATLYVQKLKEKRMEVLRHIEILENQRTIKQNELATLNDQIRSFENIRNSKR